MQYQKQPNGWSCLPTAFAILLDIPVKEIFEFCGHDGSEKVFSNCSDPHCRRSFHIQEMVEFCLSRQKAVVQISRNFCSQNLGGQKYSITRSREDILKLMKEHHGVLTGFVNGHGHAVAWVGHIIDPDNLPYDVDNFDTHTFFIIKSI